MIKVETGVERYSREVNLDDYYTPYRMQAAFHASPVRHKLLGGAAGPGKTLCLIMEHMVACNEFSDPTEAKQVHTLLLRRTHPKLEATLITRFREKVPKELYASYNDAKKVITWLNGSTTQFGSMQYEYNAYDWQGQWLKIGYDELAEFTFKQWAATAAWNRCPVSPWSTKDGASNPIGIGAGWIKSLFVDKVPAQQMDENQRAEYRRADYEYFPCTYLENPVYAEDPIFLANLNAYPVGERDALKLGLWDIAAGYFAGAWDPASNIYSLGGVEIRPHHRRWISGDWGFEHQAATYWHFIDDFGIVRTYREYVTNHEPPESLAESIVKRSYDEDGTLPKFEAFYYSHDAFHQRTDPNTIAERMGRVMRASGLPAPVNAGTDKVGREQLMYQLLVNRVRVGESADGIPLEVPEWQIAETCQKLIAVIPLAPRDELNHEKVAEFDGDDPIAGAGHGLYGLLGKPHAKPYGERVLAHVTADDMSIRMIQLAKAVERERKSPPSPIKIKRPWRTNRPERFAERT